MATSLTINPVAENVSWSLAPTTGYPSPPVDKNSVTYASVGLTQGTGAGQADTKYSAEFTIAASGTHTIDLATGLTDPFGNAIAFARIKYLYIENSSLDSASSIAVGNAGTTPFAGIWSPGTATILINNGAKASFGVAQDATGYVVSTGVNILITNNDSAHAAIVNVVIFGCSV